MKSTSYVYILASGYNGTIYIGVTSNLLQRIWQHKENQTEGFTKKYNVKKLVWYEQHDSIDKAILREKQLKKWNRPWKLCLINEFNIEWEDLYTQISELE
jgi:putative endonuclease